MHHAFKLSGRPELAHGVPLGALGVVLFFILSGLLIAQSARRHVGPNYGIREFLIDRSARIYVCFVPALIFTGLLVTQLELLPRFPSDAHAGLLQFIGNLCLLQDYPAFQLARRIGFNATWFVRPYALAEPYWTVPIEFFLYIGFGVAYFCGVKRLSKLSPRLSIAAGVAILPVFYHAATGFGQCLTLVWLVGACGTRALDLPERWAAGSKRPTLQRRLFIAGWLGGTLFLLGLRFASRGVDFYDLQSALFLAMLVLGGLWAVNEFAWITSRVISAPSAFLAQISYALYLTHNVVLGWFLLYGGKHVTGMHIALLGVICNAVAFVFWWAFDRHYRRVATWMRGFGASSAAANEGACGRTI